MGYLQKSIYYTALVAVLFFNSSCQYFKARPSRSIASISSSNCSDVMRAIMTSSKNKKKSFDDFLKTFQVSSIKKKNLKKLDQEINISIEETKYISKYIDPNNHDIDEVRNIILYSRWFEGREKEKFFKAAFNDFESAKKKYRSLSKATKKIDRYKNKQLKKLKKEGLSGEKLKKAVDRKTKSFEKLYYSCKNSNPRLNTNTSANSKKLTMAFTSASLASSALTYSTVNWDREKDGRWYGELAYTIGVSLVLNYFNSKFILANPNLKMWSQRMPMTFGAFAIEDVGVSALYGYLFAQKEDELNKQLEVMKDDPQFQKLMSDLINIIDKEELYLKYEQQSQSLLREIGSTTSDFDASKFKSIKFEDIDIDSSRDLIIEAISELEYQKNESLIELGSPAKDRYAFHRGIDILYVPTYMILTKMVYDQMCMASNPKMGFAKAVGLFTASKLTLDALYFLSRRGIIGQ